MKSVVWYSFFYYICRNKKGNFYKIEIKTIKNPQNS